MSHFIQIITDCGEAKRAKSRDASALTVCPSTLTKRVEVLRTMTPHQSMGWVSRIDTGPHTAWTCMEQQMDTKMQGYARCLSLNLVPASLEVRRNFGMRTFRVKGSSFRILGNACRQWLKKAFLTQQSLQTFMPSFAA